ncbi:MAG: peptide chain release factor-like protein [Candidatus Paceibacterota bacterium]
MSFEKINNNEKRDFLHEGDVKFEMTKSSGPGGQNVNKRSTAVRLRILLENIPITDEEKELVKNNISPRFITKEEEIIVENSEGRSQQENKNNALSIANKEIERSIQKGENRKSEQEHKNRVKSRKGKSGGSKENIKDVQKKRIRSETTEDLLKQAMEDDIDIENKFSDND